ncbi:hypothetical protein DFJ73DRAFT_581128 [Zopfochytrium polystomum]|nr:hypothetical protein DFJ73DRAFT_581128 [Zopfochytrium polystomum]
MQLLQKDKIEPSGCQNFRHSHIEDCFGPALIPSRLPGRNRLPGTFSTALNMEDQPARRILIVGGGVAGLTLALALKRAGRSTGLNLQPVIFEANGPEGYSEAGPHYVLWRWAVEILLEMGVGGRLSRIASPLMYFTSRESETDELIVQWPPADRSKDDIDAEIGVDNALPPMVATRKCDLLRLLMLAISGVRDDLVYGDDYLPTSANNSELVSDPIDDLDADLAQGRWFENEGFSDILPELFLNEKLESFRFDGTTGDLIAEFESGRVERGFMLVGADGANSVTRRLLYQDVTSYGLFPRPGPVRHTLSHAGSCIIHGITRLHVPPVDTPDSLENGKPIPDLLRDDVHEFCPDGRAIAIVGKGLSFSVAHLGNGMLGWSLLVAQSEPNKHAGDFMMQKTRKLLSESIAKNPRQSILMLAQQNKSSLSTLSGIQTDLRSAEDKWGGQIPHRRSPESHDLPDEDNQASISKSLSPSSPPINAASVTLGRRMGGGLRSHARAATSQALMEPPDDGFSGDTRTMGRRNRGGPGLNLSDPVLLEKLSHIRDDDSPTSRNPKRVSMPLQPLPFNPLPPPSAVPNLFGPLEPLTGTEARTLALRLSQNASLPHPCHALIARTDPMLTSVLDAQDLADDPLDTLTIPGSVAAAARTPGAPSATAKSPVLASPLNGTPSDFSPRTAAHPNDVEGLHAGRVVLIGDAGHPIAATATGGIGAGLALTDAALLAKLLAKHLAATPSPVLSSPASPARSPEEVVAAALSDADALRKMAVELDRERCTMVASVMREARAEGGWNRTESSLLRGLMRWGRMYTPAKWTRSTYAQMLTRGAVKSGLPSLMPVRST